MSSNTGLSSFLISGISLNYQYLSNLLAMKKENTMGSISFDIGVKGSFGIFETV